MSSSQLAEWIHEFRGLTESRISGGGLTPELEARWRELRQELRDHLSELVAKDLPESEQRHELRAPVHCAVNFWHRGRSFRARGSELSPDGLLVFTREPPPTGSVVQLALELPFAAESLLLRAEVAWTTEPKLDPPSRAGMGLHFLDIDEETAQLLEGIVIAEIGAECLRGRMPRAVTSPRDLRSRILLVDDDALFLAMQSDYLSEAGFTVVTAKRAEEGLEAVLDEDPAAVLLDLNLPDMNGDECCKILKANTSTADLPVLMATSSDRLEDVRRCFEAGCDDYLVKPVDREELIGKIRMAAVGPLPEIPGFQPRPTAVRPRVLIADDSRFFRAALGGVLSRSGYEVVVAEDGFEALRMFLTKIADIRAAIVDLRLPGLDGFQLISKIRSTPVGKELPILAISGQYQDSATVDQVKAAGAFGFWAKDRHVDDIVFRLHNLLRQVPEDFIGYPNVPFFAPVRYAALGEPIRWGGYAFGLRPDGLYLRTIAPKPLHTNLRLEFELGESGLTEANGHVLWSRAYGGVDARHQPPGMAVAFENLSLPAAEAIEAFVAANLVVG